MANKKKNTARQRRKQAARVQGPPAEIPVETVVVPKPAKGPEKQSRFGLSRWRKSPAKNVPEKEPWSRLQITVLILLAVAIQVVLSPLVVPTKSWLDSAVVFVGPQMLLGVVFAQPIARRFVHARVLGFLETLTVGATLSLVAFFAQYALVVPLVSPSSSPGATATSSPSPSQSPSLKPTPTSSPSPTTANSSPTPAKTPSTRPCPVDDPNCNHVVPSYEVETAYGMADAVGIILSIFLYPKIHRFFWMPKLRAKLREERSKKRASKSK
jgi:hypothetical protein